MAGTTSSISNTEIHQPANTGTSPVEIPNEAECSVAQPEKGIDSREIFRKSLHILPGFLCFFFQWIPHPDPIETADMIGLGVTIAVLTVVFLALFKVVRRPGESNFISTVISYPAAIFITLAVFPGNVEFASVVVIILALGDSVACFSGRLFGRRKLPWNPDKSWVGTISFVLVSAPIATAAFYLEANHPTVSFGVAAMCATTASLLAAIAESLPMKITDNLRIGVAAALGVSISAALLNAFHLESFLFGILN